MKLNHDSSRNRKWSKRSSGTKDPFKLRDQRTIHTEPHTNSRQYLCAVQCNISVLSLEQPPTHPLHYADMAPFPRAEKIKSSGIRSSLIYQQVYLTLPWQIQDCWADGVVKLAITAPAVVGEIYWLITDIDHKFRCPPHTAIKPPRYPSFYSRTTSSVDLHLTKQHDRRLRRHAVAFSLFSSNSSLVAFSWRQGKGSLAIWGIIRPLSHNYIFSILNEVFSH